MKWHKIARIVALIVLIPFIAIAVSQDYGGDPANFYEGEVWFGDGTSNSSMGETRWYDTTGNYFGIRAVAMAGNTPYDWPNAYPGVNGAPLVSTTGGVLSWGAAAAGTVSGTGTDNHIARFDGTGNIQDTPTWAISDADVMSMLDGELDLNATGATDIVLKTLAVGFGSEDRLRVLTDGTHLVGSGSAAPETSWSRAAAGIFGVSGLASGPGGWRYYEDTDNGANYFEVIAASSIGTNYSVIWPTDAPADDEFLQWNTGGQLEWTAVAGGTGTVTGNGTDNHAVRWDGTDDIQDVSQWTFADDGQFMGIAADGDELFALKRTGDADPRLTIDTNGGLEWGDGTGVADCSLKRQAAGVLSTPQPTSFNIDGYVHVDSYFEANEASAPGTPASGEGRLYLKTDGLWYGKDDAGTETKLSNVVSYVPGGTDVAVADGGTGASTAAAARTNLGLTDGWFDLTPDTVSLPLVNPAVALSIGGSNIAYDVLNFSAAASTVRNAYWVMPMPRDYNGGTIEVRISWIPKASDSGNMCWICSAGIVVDAGTLDAALGTAVNVVDACGSSTTAFRLSPTSSAITPAGTLAAQALFVLKIQSDTDNASDTRGTTADAYLIGIQVLYTKS